MQFEIKDLILRPLELADAEEVFELTSDPRVAEYMRFDTHKCLEEAVELIRSLTEEGNAAFFIQEKISGELMGIYAFAKTETPGCYGLSIFSRPRFWGKGCMTEIMLGMEPYAREVLHADMLEGHIVAKNRGSVRVAEKCGYHLAETIEIEGFDSVLLLYQKELN